jgi:hypothetical protein
MEQLKYVNHELNNNEKVAGKKLRGSKTAEEAARAMETYERPNKKYAHTDLRIANANKMMGGDFGSAVDQTKGGTPIASKGNPTKVPMLATESLGASKSESGTPESMLSGIMAASGKMLSPDMMKKMPGMLQEKLKGIDVNNLLSSSILNDGSIKMSDLNKKQSKIQPQQNVQVNQGTAKAPTVNQSSGNTEVFDVDIYKLLAMNA